MRHVAFEEGHGVFKSFCVFVFGVRCNVRWPRCVRVGVGVRVFGGGGVFVGAGVFMAMCQANIYHKMGVLICITIGYSCVYALLFFAPLCAVLVAFVAALATGFAQPAALELPKKQPRVQASPGRKPLSSR